MKKMIAFALVALLALPALAFGQTMQVTGGVTGSGSDSQVLELAGPQFDLVVRLDPAGQASSAAEFVMTELLVEIPGIFKLSTVKVLNTPLDLGDNTKGEYILAFGDCIPVGGLVELVRVGYGDFGGALTPNSDFVVSLRGFEAGDSQPSSFNGELGFVDCGDVKYTCALGGTDGGVTGSGVTFPDGGMVIQGTPLVVPTETGTMGQLKARF